MPYFLEFSPGYGLDQGYLPGVPASHGCIRMPYWKVRQFYNAVHLGTLVLINLRKSEPVRDRIVFADKLPLRQSQSAISRRRLLQQQDWGDVCKSESVVGTNIHRGVEFELYQKANAWTR